MVSSKCQGQKSCLADLDQVTYFLRITQFGSSGDRESHIVKLGLLVISHGRLLTGKVSISGK